MRKIDAKQRIRFLAGKGIQLGLFAFALALINLAAARLLPSRWDLSAGDAFTLAPQTRRLLAHLPQPVQITVLASREQRSMADRGFAPVSTMLDEMLELYRLDCPSLDVRRLDPIESVEARQLQQRFPDATAPSVVVVYGTGAAARHEILRQGDLVDARTDSGNGGRIATVDFLGEQAVTAALSRLSSGRQQTVIYCLTGHGEPALDDTQASSRRGLGKLAQHFKEIDCELRPLDLREATRIPADADLLLLAGPEQPFSAAEAARLRSYLLHDGRALMLFDLVHDPLRSGSSRDGLEDLLADYGVVVGHDRIITRGFTGQLDVASPALPASSEHPLVRSLSASSLTLYECRSVRILSSTRPITTQAVPLLVSHPFPRAWAAAESDGPDSDGATASPSGKSSDLKGPVAMALAVERPSRGTSTPVLVVVGDAEFAANRALAGPAGRPGYGFLVASVNWLRGRKDLLADIPPRRHEPYRLSGDSADHRGLVWKSALLLCAIVVTAGATVWTSRRAG